MKNIFCILIRFFPTYLHIGTHFIITLFIFFIACNTPGNIACLFTDRPRVKGHAERVTDSTVYFLPGDSLSNVKLLEYNIDWFTKEGDWHGGNYSVSDIDNNIPDSVQISIPDYDTNNVDYSFDIMGKFSRDHLFDEYRVRHLRRGQIFYNNYGTYYTEDDYVSPETGIYFLIYKYKYDKNCNLLQLEKMHQGLRLEKKYIFLYDNKDRLTKCKIHDGNNLILKQVKYTYDKSNNQTGYIIYDVKGKVINNFSFTYHEYDTAGNWQKRIKYNNNKLFAITYRNIRYF